VFFLLNTHPLPSETRNSGALKPAWCDLSTHLSGLNAGHISDQTRLLLDDKPLPRPTPYHTPQPERRVPVCVHELKTANADNVSRPALGVSSASLALSLPQSLGVRTAPLCFGPSSTTPERRRAGQLDSFDRSRVFTTTPFFIRPSSVASADLCANLGSLREPATRMRLGSTGELPLCTTSSCRSPPRICGP
jgi:hypothetical protein